MNLYKFWRELTPDERRSFCINASIGYRYMDNHLVHGKKSPSIKVLDAMVSASNGKLTHKDLVSFFVESNSRS